MKFINVFNQGMKKDLAKNIFKPDTYFHAENFTLITETGLSTGNLRNTKGNLESFSLPDSSNVVQITKLLDGTSIVTIQGQTFTVDFSNENWRSTLSSQVNSNPILSSQGITSTYSNTQVVVYSLLDNNFDLITASITASINNANGSINLAYLDAVAAPKMLGWGIIRDEIYIFSSTETSETPVNAQSQIWKITYDKFTLNANISLLYHGRLNLSLGHPIANPGMVIGNYENDLVKNLYFTDNYNVPKKINTGNPNVMALTVPELEQVPNITTGVSTIQEILSSGNLRLGNYAVTYRLSNVSGSSSGFFPQSNFIPIVKASDTSSILLYQTGDNTTDLSTKSLVGRIFNVDTSFDRISPVIIYKSSPSAAPIITELPSQPVPNNGIFTFTYSGNEIGVDITLSQFLEGNLNFETVKTIAAKNNVLFFGNVKYSDFDVLASYDSRAYRFNASRVAELTNSQGLLEYILDGTAPVYTNILPDADAIQVPETKQAPYSTNNFLYQADGVTFGGEGPNIKYTFETIVPDQSIKNDPFKIQIDNQVTSGAKFVPYANVDSNSDVIDLDQDINTIYDQTDNNGAFHNSTSPYHQYQIKGYQRDEVYRFGIVFLSKKGEASYAHWIADVRIPNVWMPSQSVGQPADNRNLYAYPTSSFVGSKWYGNTLGINFTVDVSSIKDQISGYKIVRLKREESDKTILGQGILMPTILDLGALIHYTVPHDSPVYDQSLLPFGHIFGAGLCTFASPEFLYKTHPTYSSTDQIDILGNLELMATGGILDNGSPNALIPFATYLKNYRIENGGEARGKVPITITNTVVLDSPQAVGSIGSVVVDPLIAPIQNASIPTSIPGFQQSYGNKRLAIYGPWSAFSDTSDWEDTLFNDEITDGGQGAIYLANYRRPNPSQYKGRSYSERSYSEYISTGNYRIIDTANIYTENVFGGDVQVSIFDYVNGFKNYFAGSSYTPASPGDPAYLTEILEGYLAPIETTFPVQLANNTTDRTFNKGRPYGDFAFNASPAIPTRIEMAQDFNINFDFFVENDSQVYLPKPDPYLSTSKYDVRVHRSQPKTNGELTDSWGIFKVSDFLDLDTLQGSLNQLLVHQDKLIAWQNQGISLLSVNERSVTQDNNGALQLASGGVLARYDYISKVIGSQHQFGFTQSQDSVFFFDINTKNIYKMTQNAPEAITVSKSLASYLNNNLNGLLQISDNPYLNKGLTCTYDFKYNEALFTFKDTTFTTSTKVNISSIGSENPVTKITNVNLDFGRTPKPPCILQGQTVFITFTTSGISRIESGIITTISSGSLISVSILNTQISFADSPEVSISCSSEFSFTLTYNDFISAFTTFYSFTPPVYINDQRHIFSLENNLNTLWIHDEGPYGFFYGTLYPSKITLLLNESPTETKVFDNYQMLTEVIDEVSGVNIIDKTFDRIRLYNDYQNSDFQDLPLEGSKITARRVERNWNISNIRNRVLYTTPYPNIFSDLSSTDILFGERFRDKTLFVDLEYDNLDNYKLILNSFSTEIRKSIR